MNGRENEKLNYFHAPLDDRGDSGQLGGVTRGSGRKWRGRRERECKVEGVEGSAALPNASKYDEKKEKKIGKNCLCTV